MIAPLRVSCLLSRVAVWGQRLFLTCLPPWYDTIALPWRDLPRHGYGLASSLPTLQRFPNFNCSIVHNTHVVLAWTGPCFLETFAKNIVWSSPKFSAPRPFCSIHGIPSFKNQCFISGFWRWSQFGCLCRGLKGHGFMSVLNLLDKSFEFCVSADFSLHSLVDFIYVLAWESPVFAVEESKQSEACYSCVCCDFFL